MGKYLFSESYSGPEVFKSCCQKCLKLSGHPSSVTSCRDQCICATLKCNDCVFMDFRFGKVTAGWVSFRVWTAMNEWNSNHISLLDMIRLMNFSGFMKMWLLWFNSFAFSWQNKTVYVKVKDWGTSHHVVSGSPFSSSIKSPVWKQSGVFPGGAGVPW